MCEQWIINRLANFQYYLFLGFMASHDNVGITILPPEKKRRITSFVKCVICQADKNDVLRKGKESSVETLISALSLRQDEVYERLYPKNSNHLKKRLQHHFTTSIVFHQPSDKSKPELLYSSEISVQDVINAAIKRPTTPETAGAMDETRQIFHTAKFIKNEIKKCKGISIRPLDINLESAKSIVPRSLYMLLHWIIACDNDVYEESAASSSCRNMADERRVLSIDQWYYPLCIKHPNENAQTCQPCNDCALFDDLQTFDNVAGSLLV